MVGRKGWQDVTEVEILQANYDKYNDDNIVNFYKDYKEPKYSYTEYEVIFSAVLKLLSKDVKGNIRAVDMCGGAGKAAFVMKKCYPQAEVTLVDLSDKMLDIARQRMKDEDVGYIEIVEDNVMSFLEKDREFDLVVFSSAVHHFKDPVQLLTTAAKRLSDHGVIVTIADPTTLTKSKRYKFFEFMLSKRADKVKIISTLMQFPRSSVLDEVAASAEDFDIAEYQTITGIDDLRLRDDLALYDLRPLLHMRYPAGDPFIIRILTLINLPWAFSMILGKGSQNRYASQINDLWKDIEKSMPFKITRLS